MQIVWRAIRYATIIFVMCCCSRSCGETVCGGSCRQIPITITSRDHLLHHHHHQTKRTTTNISANLLANRTYLVTQLPTDDRTTLWISSSVSAPVLDKQHRPFGNYYPRSDATKRSDSRPNYRLVIRRWV